MTIESGMKFVAIYNVHRPNGIVYRKGDVVTVDKSNLDFFKLEAHQVWFAKAD